MIVSIVTPTLALDSFLEEARQSVARQTKDVSIEHIIVVDSRDVALPRDEVDGNVQTRFLHNRLAKGPGGARNTALDCAQGAIIFFLDADDIWSDGHVCRVVSVYENYPQVDCVSVAGLSFGEKILRSRLTVPALPQGFVSRGSVAWNPIGGPTGFSYRRSSRTATVRFRDALYFADIMFYLELLHLGAVFWRENSVRYWYRRSVGQLISISPIDKIRQSEMVVHNCIAEWKCNGLSKREAALASVQIRRLSANRQRRRDYRNTALLALMAPRWAIAQARRQLGNVRLSLTRLAVPSDGFTA